MRGIGREEKEEKEKFEKNKEEEKSKSEKAREKRKETDSDEGKEGPYPLVPSKKDKERHLARFLDIFRKLEITMPFGEALQQMLLYSKISKIHVDKEAQVHTPRKYSCGG